MGKRIYVGNLPWSITKDKLEGLFSSFGEIEEALVIANKYTGRSRGFGFVTFKKDEDANKAISGMDGKEVDGRNLVVKEARPLEESKGEEVSEEKGKKEGQEPEKKIKEKEVKEVVESLEGEEMEEKPHKKRKPRTEKKRKEVEE